MLITLYQSTNYLFALICLRIDQTDSVCLREDYEFKNYRENVQAGMRWAQVGHAMTEAELFLFVGAAAVVVACALYAGLYNGVLRYLNMIPEIESNIGVLWRKREDLIGKLQGIVDSYGLHESGVAVGVSGQLGGSTATASPSLTARLTSLRMAFPELKADGLYSTLMEQLASVETELSSRREQYNSVVRAYNTAISEFPSNLLLRPFAFKAKPFWVEQGTASAQIPLPPSHLLNAKP